MKRRFRFGQNTYKLLFLHNQLYVVPLLLIVVCIAVFYLIIIPQYDELVAMRKEEEAVRTHIDTLQKNITLLQGLNDSVLDAQFTTISHVLPSEKDFIGLLNAVAIAATNAGVSVEDFSFLVGPINTPQVTGGKQTLQVELSVKGGINGGKQFMAEVAKQVPLVEVLTSETQTDQTKIKALFYYKPYAKSEFDSNILLNPLSAADTQLLSEFASWQSAPPPNEVSGGNIPVPSGTPSATVTPSVSPLPQSSPSAGISR